MHACVHVYACANKILTYITPNGVRRVPTESQNLSSAPDLVSAFHTSFAAGMDRQWTGGLGPTWDHTRKIPDRWRIVWNSVLWGEAYEYLIVPKHPHFGNPISGCPQAVGLVWAEVWISRLGLCTVALAEDWKKSQQLASDYAVCTEAQFSAPLQKAHGQVQGEITRHGENGRKEGPTLGKTLGTFLFSLVPVSKTQPCG